MNQETTPAREVTTLPESPRGPQKAQGDGACRGGQGLRDPSPVTFRGSQAAHPRSLAFLLRPWAYRDIAQDKEHPYPSVGPRRGGRRQGPHAQAPGPRLGPPFYTSKAGGGFWGASCRPGSRFPSWKLCWADGPAALALAAAQRFPREAGRGPGEAPSGPPRCLGRQVSLFVR